MTALPLVFNPLSTPSVSVPVSGVSEWLTVIDPSLSGSNITGLAAGDPVSVSNTIIRIDNIGAGKRTFRRASSGGLMMGTSLRLRVCYPPLPGGAEPFPGTVTHPVLRVFGGTMSDPMAAVDLRKLAPLRNASGEGSVLFRLTPAEDAIVLFVREIGGVTITEEHHVTSPDNAVHTWDCDGCNVFVVGVERAFAVGFSNYEHWKAFVQAKIV